MKKVSKAPKSARVSEAMRTEYEFAGGVRGKFADGTNLVLLAPDVAAEFPTSTAVNKALRQVMKTRSKHRTA